jgi:hypothetical protein
MSPPTSSFPGALCNAVPRRLSFLGRIEEMIRLSKPHASLLLSAGVPQAVLGAGPALSCSVLFTNCSVLFFSF